MREVRKIFPSGKLDDREIVAGKILDHCNARLDLFGLENALALHASQTPTTPPRCGDGLNLLIHQAILAFSCSSEE